MLSSTAQRGQLQPDSTGDSEAARQGSFHTGALAGNKCPGIQTLPGVDKESSHPEESSKKEPAQKQGWVPTNDRKGPR